MAQTTLADELRRYEIGGKLRALRLKKKLGLVDLGRHTGLSPALLSKLERGKMFPTAGGWTLGFFVPVARVRTC